MAEEIKTENNNILPVLPLRGLVIFPYTVTHFDVGRAKSVKALEEAMINNQMVFLAAQKDESVSAPAEADIYRIGTIAKVKQLVKLPGDTIRVLVEGMARGEINEIIQTEPFFTAAIIEHDDSEKKTYSLKTEALLRRVKSAYEEYVKMSNKTTPEVAQVLNNIEIPSQLCDIISSNLFIKVDLKQELLSEFNPTKRLEKLYGIMLKEIDILEIESDINSKVRKQMDKLQKEYFLREQLKVIQTELGDRDGVITEIEEYKRMMAETKFPEEVEKKIEKELDRLAKTPQGSAEVSVIRTYLDWIFELPWNKTTEEKLDLQNARKILQEDHYGLEKVKERIIEYLAVRKLKNSLKGPIICLVGPPGVGKTSIAKSIAKALNRNYVRMSLGGVKDEAEIRGHRRTYVGALPGRIISAIKLAGTKNPLMLLDEIDKMGNDFRGDPSSAMLEVLDAEQNFAFRDHYLELPFDLSNVLFLTTANTTDTIPRALLDRMEVIRISGYTEEEKLNIIKNHLLPKQLLAHGLKKSNLRLSDTTIRFIINHYTRESGVRNLERELSSVCRKAAVEIITHDKKSVAINEKNIEDYLGAKKFRYEMSGKTDEVGLATGLAWTSVGGETLTVEVNIMNGSGKFELTGQLGDVMKESARAAVSYIKSNSGRFNIDDIMFNQRDIHIHVPEGAIPKDGPSAGITMATAMISALTDIPVRKNVAMTGEITLRGRVLPIGGLKEKVLAANRAGIDTVIIPEDNRRDADDIPDNVKKAMKLVFASEMFEVLDIALVNGIKSFPRDAKPEVSFSKPKTGTVSDNLRQ